MTLETYKLWLSRVKQSLNRLNPEDVEDAFNDALMTVHKQGKDFVNDAHAYSYIKTTTKNKALNLNSNKNTVIRKNTKLAETLRVLSQQESPLDIIIKKETIDKQKQLVYKYSDVKQKQIVDELIKDCDRKYVGSKLKIKENTINSQIRHIKNKIGAAW